MCWLCARHVRLNWLFLEMETRRRLKHGLVPVTLSEVCQLDVDMNSICNDLESNSVMLSEVANQVLPDLVKQRNRQIRGQQDAWARLARLYQNERGTWLCKKDLADQVPLCLEHRRSHFVSAGAKTLELATQHESGPGLDLRGPAPAAPVAIPNYHCNHDGLRWIGRCLVLLSANYVGP